jgi:hypothetical protein
MTSFADRLDWGRSREKALVAIMRSRELFAIPLGDIENGGAPKLASRAICRYSPTSTCHRRCPSAISARCST